MKRTTPFVLWLGIALCITGCDQATKLGALATLTDTFAGVQSIGDGMGRLLDYRHPRPTADLEIIGGFWRLRYAENPGAAFSMFVEQGPAGRFALTVFRALILLGLVVWLRRSAGRPRIERFGLALLAGGAAGNLLDGLRLGYVVDWIQWHWQDRWHWPTFNVADAALVCGIALLLVAAFRDRNSAPHGV